MSLNLERFRAAKESFEAQQGHAQSFMDRYIANAKADALEKTEKIRNTAEALNEGVLAAQATKTGVSKIRSLFKQGKSKDGDEDGDGLRDGEETEGEPGEAEVAEPEAEETEPLGEVNELQQLRPTAEDLQGRTAQEQMLDRDPEDPDFHTSTEASGEADGTEDAGGELGEATNDAEAGEEAGEATAELGTDIGEVTGATALETAGEAASIIAPEIVLPLAGLAAAGYGLYELFGGSSDDSAPPPPNTTASSRGENIFPSFDGVLDTPANNSAF
jgi:hypothetical protein